jgi:uncharacterized repeat protein (TIGR01451 family)
MMRSTDGGVTWQTDQQLTTLMNDGFRGVLNDPGDGVRVMPQPTLIAFDPQNPNTIVAGGRQSGVFLSGDGGRNWSLLTDPHTPGTSGIPHLPQPAFAHFDHDKPGFIRIYLGTGRGVWRVDIPVADVRITKTDLPDPAFAGESLTYSITVFNNGPSAASGITVRDALPSGVTYAGGPAFCSATPDGTLTCSPVKNRLSFAQSFAFDHRSASQLSAHHRAVSGGTATVSHTAIHRYLLWLGRSA